MLTFVHPLLLGGLLLVGIPVLIHFIMQQKPKRLLFPAFRFLVLKHRTNQRSLRLRHFLLLLLRMILVALICLALARPKMFSDRIDLGNRQPVALALVLDTSMSMGYTVGGKTRLEDARRRALELLDDLPSGSRIAVFDSGEPASGEWIATTALARDRLTGLDLKPANGPVTDAIGQAFRLFQGLDDDPETRNEQLPRFLYVFSDRTRECWDTSRVPQLIDLKTRSEAKVRAAFVDVGVDKPVDLAIVDLELPRQVIPANSRAIIRARVQAVGQDYDTEILCRIDGEKTAERRAIKLKAGQSEVVSFERRNLALGLHQAEIALAATDNLTFNNARFATFEITGARKVLTISDHPDEAVIWKLALRVGELKGDLAFDGDVKSTPEANKMTADDLAKYKAVCLLNVAAPDAGLWKKLHHYVENGGGLVVVPGGEELDKAAYNNPEDAKHVMPGRFKDLIHRPLDKPVSWRDDSYTGPVKDWFAEWKKQVDPPVDFMRIPPKALQYWEVTKGEASVLALYHDEKNRPALLERTFDRQKVRGRVLLLTTPFDGRRLDSKSDYQWNDYLTSAFYVALVKKIIGYLTGDQEDANLNHTCGQSIRIVLPPEGRFPGYILQGPGLSAQAGQVARTPLQNELVLNQPALAGNYELLEPGKKWRSLFSMNVLPAESDLTRVPVEQIEVLFGPKSVLPVGHNINFRDELFGHWSQPIELFPWLMILLLLAMAAENLLANKFYRRPTEDAKTDEGKLKIEN